MSDKTVIHTKYGDFDGVEQLFKYMLQNDIKVVRVKVNQDKRYARVPRVIMTRGRADRYLWKNYAFRDDMEFQRLRFEYWRTTLKYKFSRIIYKFKK